jgi:hypothetical protein
VCLILFILFPLAVGLDCFGYCSPPRVYFSVCPVYRKNAASAAFVVDRYPCVHIVLWCSKRKRNQTKITVDLVEFIFLLEIPEEENKNKMRLLRREAAVLATAACARGVATYGKVALSHAQVVQRFGTHKLQDASSTDELALLETVEGRIRNWRLNKWEFRVPVLLSQAEKESAQLQLHKIKTLVLDHAKTQDLIDRDMETVCRDLSVTKEELRGQTRAWLQEKIAELRWKGEVTQAKAIRDAFVRLEAYGSRDFRYFERLCCVYGMAKLGTFEDAFSNFVVPSGNDGGVALDTSSPFHDLMHLLVTKYPTLDQIFDFLGFNDLEGYRASLGKYMKLALEHKHQSTSSTSTGSRVLFQSNASGADREVLFDFQDSSKTVAATEASHAAADFVHVRGQDITLITIVSKNRWLRSRQVAHQKQLEGVGRRASFVLQIPYEDVRIRSLLLPALYLDKASLNRINKSVLRLTPENVKSFAPWAALYEKELDLARDADYAEMSRVKPEEEWVKL